MNVNVKVDSVDFKTSVKDHPQRGRLDSARKLEKRIG